MSKKLKIREFINKLTKGPILPLFFILHYVYSLSITSMFYLKYIIFFINGTVTFLTFYHITLVICSKIFKKNIKLFFAVIFFYNYQYVKFMEFWYFSDLNIYVDSKIMLVVHTISPLFSYLYHLRHKYEELSILHIMTPKPKSFLLFIKDILIPLNKILSKFFDLFFISKKISFYELLFYGQEHLNRKKKKNKKIKINIFRLRYRRLSKFIFLRSRSYFLFNFPFWKLLIYKLRKHIFIILCLMPEWVARYIFIYSLDEFFNWFSGKLIYLNINLYIGIFLNKAFSFIIFVLKSFLDILPSVEFKSSGMLVESYLYIWIGIRIITIPYWGPKFIRKLLNIYNECLYFYQEEIKPYLKHFL